MSATGRYPEAERLLRQTVELQQKLFGWDHPNVARTLLYLGEINNARGKPDAAEDMFQRALRTLQARLGPDHLEVAAAENSFGLFYMSRARDSEAESLFVDALRVVVKTVGRNHLLAAAVLSGLGLLDHRNRQYVAARAHYADALRILQQLAQGGKQPALVINSIARTYADEGDFAKAEPLYVEALEMAERSLGPNEPEIAALLYNRSEALRKLGRNQEAKTLFRRAESIRTQIVASDPARHRIDYRDLEQSRGRTGR